MSLDNMTDRGAAWPELPYAAWKDTYTADLSVAKAVEGPRNDWRAFVILGAKF